MLLLGGTAVAGLGMGVGEYAAAGTEAGQAFGAGAGLLLAIRAIGGYVRHVRTQRSKKEAELLAEALRHMSH